MSRNFLPTEDGEFNGNAQHELRPFSTYPEDREKLLALAAKAELSDDAAAIELADLVKAIITDEQALLDAEMFDQMSEEFSLEVDQAWGAFKAASPVAQVVNDNQPNNTAIIEILCDPPTLSVGTKLFAAPVKFPAT